MDKKIQELKNKITSYADQDKKFGWFEIEYEGEKYRFPKRALIHYTFRRSAFNGVLPKYTAFSPGSFKMILDCQFHTDVMIGAGFDVDNAYSVNRDTQKDVLLEAMLAIQEEYSDSYTKSDFVILANGRKEKNFAVRFYDHTPLKKNERSSVSIWCSEKERGILKGIVLPHAGIEFDLAAQMADVIVTEVGGKLCHLATVSKERNKILILMKDATKKLDYFKKAHIYLENGQNVLRVL